MHFMLHGKHTHPPHKPIFDAFVYTAIRIIHGNVEVSLITKDKNSVGIREIRPPSH